MKRGKIRHDTLVHDSPVISVGSSVAYLNKDLKTLSIGKVESHTLRSYVLLTGLAALLIFTVIIWSIHFIWFKSVLLEF